MNDYKRNLYICLMEECAEVTKEVAKILRFGEEDFSPLDPTKQKNIDRLSDEIIDLLAVMEMVKAVQCSEDELDMRVQMKKDKVNKYYAMYGGKIEDESNIS